jgi:Carboxypeptidase regulatory-like domain
MKNLHILFLILVLIGFANAQDSVLSGTVFDAVKAVVPVTKIEAKNTTGQVFNTISNSDGFYEMTLPFGKYEIEFYRNGFKKFILKNFENTSTNKVKFNVDFLVGHCEDCNGAILGERDENETKPTIVDYAKVKGSAKKIIRVCGTITDDVGAIVQNAKVEIKLTGKKTFVTYSDENGEFNIEIPTGIYKISISAESFKKTVLKNQIIDSESECFTFKLKSNITPHQIT